MGSNGLRADARDGWRAGGRQHEVVMVVVLDEEKK